LEAFERLRAAPAAEEAAKRAPDLVKGADRFLAQSRKEWQGNDLDDARKAALLGQIKLKHAMAISEQENAKRRISAADNELATRQDEFARLQKDLSAMKEQVALLQKLNEAASERQKLSEQLTAEQQQTATERQRAAASDKISDAELAIKSAETVNAANYATVPFNAAMDNLKRARQELQQGNFQAAQTSAELARQKADEAATAAKPRHAQDTQAAESQAQAEALAREAASIPGITVRREARGAVQRLVLPLGSDKLFNRRDTTVSPSKGQALLDSVAAVIKKYPRYPVQVVGYSDNRGRTGELLAMSLARAQSVYSALVLRGVDAKRMVVSGQGSAEPISDNRSVAGRALNNRVEVIFLYQ
jgi:outer membrane protein OmpA-like peptidoglycan-associated protein